MGFCGIATRHTTGTSYSNSRDIPLTTLPRSRARAQEKGTKTIWRPIASTWEPGHPRWEIKGYQAAITQVFVGVGINWIGEFAPEIGKVFKNK